MMQPGSEGYIVPLGCGCVPQRLGPSACKSTRPPFYHLAVNSVEQR